MRDQHIFTFRRSSLSTLAATLAFASLLAGCNNQKPHSLTTTTYDITDLTIIPKWDPLDSENYQDFEPMSRARAIQTTVDALIKPIPAPIENPTAEQVHEGQAPTPPPSSLTLDTAAKLTVTASPDAQKLVSKFLLESRHNKIQTVTHVRAWVVTLPANQAQETLTRIADVQGLKVGTQRGYFLYSDKQRQSLFDQASSSEYMGRLRLLNPGSGLLEWHGQPANNSLAIDSNVKMTTVEARELKHEWMMLDYESATLYITLKVIGFEPLTKSFSTTSETNAVFELTPVIAETDPAKQTTSYLVLGVVIDRPAMPHPMP